MSLFKLVDIYISKAVNSSEIPKEFFIENQLLTWNSGSRYDFSKEKSLELTNLIQKE